MNAEEAENPALTQRLKQEAKYYAAPAGLAARVMASLPAESERVTTVGAQAIPSRRNPWFLASALSGAFALMLGVGLYLGLPGPDDRLADEAIAGHVRALMVDHAADVASSDSHAVKPWFAGKLDFSPPVVDLTSQGFTLVGGRLDYLDRRPVAALVYRHRQHLINLFVWPSTAEQVTQKREKQGFRLLRWTKRGMNYWAVSDLNAGELAQFQALLDKAE
jgi:anti-sigma factor RsiW